MTTFPVFSATPIVIELAFSFVTFVQVAESCKVFLYWGFESQCQTVDVEIIHIQDEVEILERHTTRIEVQYL